LPPPWTSVVASVATSPRETDFRDDVEELRTALLAGRVSFSVSRFDELRKDAVRRAERSAVAAGLLAPYCQSRGAAVTSDYLERIGQQSARLAPIEQPTAATSVVTHGWLTPALGGPVPSAWGWGADAAERVVTVMLRSLKLEPRADVAREALSKEKRRIAAVQRYIDGKLLEQGRLDWGPDEVAGALTRIYVENNVPAALAGCVRRAADAFAAQTGCTPGEAVEAALCVEVMDGCGSVPVDLTAPPIFDFLQMGIDELPLQAVSKQPQAPAVPATNVLYGTRLAHFAAFGEAKWREWDWMWGRLHGAFHVCRLLGLDDATTGGILDAILAAEGTNRANLNQKLDAVLNQTSGELLGEMTFDTQIRVAIDSIFRLLTSRIETDPPVPGALRTVGGLLSAVLSHSRPSNAGGLGWTLRILLSPARWLFWWYTRKRIKDGAEAPAAKPAADDRARSRILTRLLVTPAPGQGAVG
jgi:hypothetical protein